MCIRDRMGDDEGHIGDAHLGHLQHILNGWGDDAGGKAVNLCLLYTSDAADERSSVDLGGRRIIKKKNTTED